jgi:general secretion pathway protein B
VSYILDALKKSEKERQKKNVPDLLTVQEPILNERRRRTLWPYVLVAALILNMGLLGYLLGPKESKKTKSNDAIVQKQDELNPLESQKPETTKVEIPASAPSVKEISQRKQPIIKEKETKTAAVSVQQKKPLSEKAGQEHTIQEKAIVQSVKPPMGKETQSVQTQPTGEKTTASAEPPVSHKEKSEQTDTPPEPGKIYNPGELPLSIQQKLPSVNVSIFMYSDDPASRMVRINGQTYREGQKISEDLTLERITPNGIILNYKNYRFLAGQHP